MAAGIALDAERAKVASHSGTLEIARRRRKVGHSRSM